MAIKILREENETGVEIEARRVLFSIPNANLANYLGYYDVAHRRHIVME